MAKPPRRSRPLAWRTRWPRSSWCGATAQLPYRDGTVFVTCTRFSGHLTHPKSKDPLKHFDELRKQSWHDDLTDPCPPPPE